MTEKGLTLVDYKEKYYRYLHMLADGRTNLSKMALEVGVTRQCLLNWSKKECFKSDLDLCVKGLLPLNVQRVINGQMNAAIDGDAAAARLYLHHETGYTEKIGVQTEFINADAAVGGVIQALKAKNGTDNK
jgi:hypothetical protein